MNKKLLGGGSSSKFIKMFGGSPINKVLDFLVVFDKFDYSMMDIAEHSKVGYSTLKILLPQLIKRKIVIETRISGKSSMYQINKKNPLVQSFVKFYWEITDKMIAVQLKGRKVLV